MVSVIAFRKIGTPAPHSFGGGEVGLPEVVLLLAEALGLQTFVQVVDHLRVGLAVPAGVFEKLLDGDGLRVNELGAEFGRFGGSFREAHMVGTARN